jgi:hypothetical protein
LGVILWTELSEGTKDVWYRFPRWRSLLNPDI